jgi:hypothetical protein
VIGEQPGLRGPFSIQIVEGRFREAIGPSGLHEPGGPGGFISSRFSVSYRAISMAAARTKSVIFI